VRETTQVEGLLGAVYPLAEEVHRALLGAVFPLTRKQIVWIAHENEAPDTLLSLLSALPEGRFGLDEVTRLLSEG
jgi:hypothetical protein